MGLNDKIVTHEYKSIPPNLPIVLHKVGIFVKFAKKVKIFGLFFSSKYFTMNKGLLLASVLSLI